MIEEEYLDKTKYFLIPEEDKEFFEREQDREYALKGTGHRSLAYRIISKTGLDRVYFRYQERTPAAVFLTYCGYILVDENEIKFRNEDGLYDESEEVVYTVVGYSSAAISKERIKQLKKIYKGKETYFSDSNPKKDGLDKERIDEIIESVRKLRTERERQKIEKKEKEDIIDK